MSKPNPFCEYKSTRFIRVYNPTLVAVYYVTIVAVLCYVVIFTIVVEKGYQTTDQVSGTTSVKVKGSSSSPPIPSLGSFSNQTVWDAMDIIQPATEENALFVTTSFIFTPNQTRGICEGNRDTDTCSTNDTTNCTAGEYNTDSLGIITGTCGSGGFCQVYGWCPLEDDENPVILDNIGEFTILVKVDVRFNGFGVSRSNTVDKQHNGAPSPGYNLWTVQDILGNATGGTTVSEVAVKGAIVVMTSEWNCDLDKGKSKCNPKFKFTRLDSASSISPGYNYRKVSYDPTGTSRLLQKLIGIRFVFIVDGVAGEFSFAALTVTFGAGLAYLGVASYIADIVLQYFLKESKKYEKVKNTAIHDDEDGVSLRSSDAGSYREVQQQ